MKNIALALAVAAGTVAFASQAGQMNGKLVAANGLTSVDTSGKGMKGSGHHKMHKGTKHNSKMSSSSSNMSNGSSATDNTGTGTGTGTSGTIGTSSGGTGSSTGAGSTGTNK